MVCAVDVGTFTLRYLLHFLRYVGTTTYVCSGYRDRGLARAYNLMAISTLCETYRWRWCTDHIHTFDASYRTYRYSSMEIFFSAFELAFSCVRAAIITGYKVGRVGHNHYHTRFRGSLFLTTIVRLTSVWFTIRHVEIHRYPAMYVRSLRRRI